MAQLKQQIASTVLAKAGMVWEWKQIVLQLEKTQESKNADVDKGTSLPAPRPPCH